MDILLFLKTIIPTFFAILFLQSGLDKVFDWKGNLEFHKEHFANSPLRHYSTLNLGFIAILEVCCGTLCLVGALLFILKGNTGWSIRGVELAAFVFTMLFFGQRISKDYAGAATIANYFVLAIVSLVILNAA